MLIPEASEPSLSCGFIFTELLNCSVPQVVFARRWGLESRNYAEFNLFLLEKLPLKSFLLNLISMLSHVLGTVFL